MMYSSAVFKEPGMTLEQASDYKKELICQKLQLKPMDHLVEIGSGWGRLCHLCGSALWLQGRPPLPFPKLSTMKHVARVAEAGLSHRVSVAASRLPFTGGQIRQTGVD